MNRIRIVIIILIIGLVGSGGGYLYSYVNSRVTNAINLVHASKENADYRDDFTNSSTTVSVVYTFLLENPTEIDILYSYYIETYYEGEYIMTIEFEELIPAKRSVTVETTTYIGHEGTETLKDAYLDSEAIFHSRGSFIGKGRFLLLTITKSWTEEWDTPV